jgi:methyl-accepting chemotaxis protein
MASTRNAFSQRFHLGLRTRITAALALASAGTAVFVLLGAMWIISGIIDRADERELRSHYDALQSRLGQESRRAAAMSAVVASIPAVQEAMARGDRDALMGLFGAGFAALKSDYGVDQFQFHTPPAISYLRVHQPQKFGDDLSSFRKTVVAANQQRKPILGLEGGVAGLGIRGVVPVAQAAKHLGSVEFGLTFGQTFFDEFKRTRGVDIALHLSANSDFKLFGGTLGGQSFFDAADYRGARDGGFSVRQGKLGAMPVAALLGPIKDFSGNPIGAVEIVMNNSEYVASLDRARQLAISMALFGISIAAAAGLLIARGISRPILSRRRCAISRVASWKSNYPPISARTRSAKWCRRLPCSRTMPYACNGCRRIRPRPRRNPSRRSAAPSRRWPTVLRPACAASSSASRRRRPKCRRPRSRCPRSSNNRGSRR